MLCVGHSRECVKIAFGVRTRVGPRNHGALELWGPAPPPGGGLFGGHHPVASCRSAFSVKRLNMWVEPTSCQSYITLTLPLTLTLTLRPLT